jgi:hypothetical protein
MPQASMDKPARPAPQRRREGGHRPDVLELILRAREVREQTGAEEEFPRLYRYG